MYTVNAYENSKLTEKRRIQLRTKSSLAGWLNMSPAEALQCLLIHPGCLFSLVPLHFQIKKKKNVYNKSERASVTE